MRTGLLIAAVLLTSTSVRGEIAWRPDLKTAYDEATRSGKLILVHFYSDDCVWCDRLEQGVFADPAVAAAMEAQFVPVKINGPRDSKISSAFSVSRYPTDVVVHRDGSVLSHKTSPQDVSRYLAMLSGPEVMERIAEGSSPAQNAFAAARSALAPIADSRAPQAAPTQSPEVETSTVAGFDDSSVGGDSAVAVASGMLGIPASGQPNPQVAGPGPELAGFQMPPGIAAGGFDMGAFAGTPATAVGHRGAGLSAPANGTSTATRKPDRSAFALPESDFSPAATAATATRRTRELPPEAMDGFCPVTVANEAKWEPGKPEFGVIHLGQLYLFTSAEAQRTFQASPDRFTPVLNGIDVVKFFEERKVVPGSREWGLKSHERMFFFADEASMNHFNLHHERYAMPAIELMERAAVEANGGR